MKMHRQCGFGEFVASVATLVVAFIAYVILGNWSCHSQWARSGMIDISWGPVQGCLVKLPDGRWLPEDRIREIDIPRPEKKER